MHHERDTQEIFQEIKDFIGFTAEDVASLQAIAPIFATKGAAITDLFYVKLDRRTRSRASSSRAGSTPSSAHTTSG
jgi:hypothetical protein